MRFVQMRAKYKVCTMNKTYLALMLLACVVRANAARDMPSAKDVAVVAENLSKRDLDFGTYIARLTAASVKNTVVDKIKEAIPALGYIQCVYLSAAVILVAFQTGFNARTGGSGIKGNNIWTILTIGLCPSLDAFMGTAVLKAWDAAKANYGAGLLLLLMLCICPYNMLCKMEEIPWHVIVFTGFSTIASQYASYVLWGYRGAIYSFIGFAATIQVLFRYTYMSLMYSGRLDFKQTIMWNRLRYISTREIKEKYTHIENKLKGSWFDTKHDDILCKRLFTACANTKLTLLTNAICGGSRVGCNEGTIIWISFAVVVTGFLQEGRWGSALVGYMIASVLAVVYKIFFEIPCMGSNMCSVRYKVIRQRINLSNPKVIPLSVFRYIARNQVPDINKYWLEAFSVKDIAKDVVYYATWILYNLVAAAQILSTFAVDMLSIPQKIIEFITSLCVGQDMDEFFEHKFDMVKTGRNQPKIDESTGEVSLVRTQHSLQTRSCTLRARTTAIGVGIYMQLAYEILNNMSEDAPPIQKEDNRFETPDLVYEAIKDFADAAASTDKRGEGNHGWYTRDVVVAHVLCSYMLDIAEQWCWRDREEVLGGRYSRNEWKTILRKALDQTLVWIGRKSESYSVELVNPLEWYDDALWTWFVGLDNNCSYWQSHISTGGSKSNEESGDGDSESNEGSGEDAKSDDSEQWTDDGNMYTLMNRIIGWTLSNMHKWEIDCYTPIMIRLYVAAFAGLQEIRYFKQYEFVDRDKED